MESEKVKEIKKALKFCCDECDCDCPFYKNGKSYEKCKSLLLFKALTLINELESENETIKLNMQETEKASFNINKMNGNLVIENQQLKDRITELKRENGELNEKITVFDPISAFADNYAKGVKEAEKVVVGALKQFAEMLIEKAKKGSYIDKRSHANLTDFIVDIDETLKEFINKGDEER